MRELTNIEKFRLRKNGQSLKNNINKRFKIQGYFFFEKDGKEFLGIITNENEAFITLSSVAISTFNDITDSFSDITGLEFRVVEKESKTGRKYIDLEI